MTTHFNGHMAKNSVVVGVLQKFYTDVDSIDIGGRQYTFNTFTWEFELCVETTRNSDFKVSADMSDGSVREIRLKTISAPAGNLIKISDAVTGRSKDFDSVFMQYIIVNIRKITNVTDTTGESSKSLIYYISSSGVFARRCYVQFIKNRVLKISYTDDPVDHAGSPLNTLGPEGDIHEQYLRAVNEVYSLFLSLHPVARIYTESPRGNSQK
jgi:hypothetical protein